MFWNNETCFYHFSDLLKQCDVFPSLWRSFETIWCGFITLAMFWNNVMWFYHFGDGLKQCDVFLSLWRSFETMWCGSITLAMVWNNAMCFYHFGDLFLLLVVLFGVSNQAGQRIVQCTAQADGRLKPWAEPKTKPWAENRQAEPKIGSAVLDGLWFHGRPINPSSVVIETHRIVSKHR